MTEERATQAERIRRLQMSELVERILSEAVASDRPGALTRLESIAADVASLERQNARLVSALTICEGQK